jgi:hypothetical protein
MIDCQFSVNNLTRKHGSWRDAQELQEQSAIVLKVQTVDYP